MTASLHRRDFLSSTAAIAAATLVLNQSADTAETTGESPFKTTLKKGFCLSMLSDNKLSIEDRFRLAKDIGLDGVEAYTTENPKSVEQQKNAAEKAGIEIHSVMNTLHWKYPLSSNKPDDVDKSLKGMETSLRNAKAWGADTVLLVPAVVDKNTMYKDAYARSQTQIRKLLPLAEELGVVIAIENVWNKFLLSPLEFTRYVDEFNSPWLQAYFDVGNIVLYGFPQDWIRTLRHRIKKVHIKGFHTEKKQFTNIRDGSIDWPEVRRTLDEVGYNGYITAELGGGDEKYLRDVSERMDLIIAGK
jgi:hexulose-6-phosphate isomerase